MTHFVCSSQEIRFFVKFSIIKPVITNIKFCGVTNYYILIPLNCRSFLYLIQAYLGIIKLVRVRKFDRLAEIRIRLLQELIETIRSAS